MADVKAISPTERPRMSETPKGPQTGDMIDGRFRIDGKLGSGGMAVVLRAFDLRTNLPVALKLMSRSLIEQPKAYARFRRESEIARSLQHPHIARTFDEGSTVEGQPYLLMELLEGETLRDRMRHGPLQLSDASQIALQVAEALAFAHQNGIVHRDLKPENIFLARQNGEEVVKLLDFGIARPRTFDASITGTGEMVGTLRYMAPEVLVLKSVTVAADVYAMGLIMLEMMLGRPVVPPSATVLHHLVSAPRIPDRLWDTDYGQLVSRCLRKHPVSRPHSGQLLARELAEMTIEVDVRLGADEVATQDIVVDASVLSNVMAGISIDQLHHLPSPEPVTRRLEPANHGADSKQQKSEWGIGLIIAAALSSAALALFALETFMPTKAKPPPPSEPVVRRVEVPVVEAEPAPAEDRYEESVAEDLPSDLEKSEPTPERVVIEEAVPESEPKKKLERKEAKIDDFLIGAAESAGKSTQEQRENATKTIFLNLQKKNQEQGK